MNLTASGIHRAQWCLLAAVWVLWQGAAGAADQVVIDAARRGTAVAIDARASLRVPFALIWQTLTDYDRLHEFVPGIRRSRVIERRGPAAIVEQNGAARFLLFSIPIDVIVESVEIPPNVIEIRVLKGNLRQLDGRYQIDSGAEPGVLVLRWFGLIEPEIGVPPLVGVPLMRANIADQFLGMVREIERRHALSNVAAH